MSIGKRDVISGLSDMKRVVLYPTLDAFLNVLQRRFSEQSREIFRSLSGLDPTSNKFLDFEKILRLARYYNLNLEDIEMETTQARRMLEKKGEIFETIDEFAEFLNPLNLAFSELCKAVKIAMTLPVRTAGCERTFSKLNHQNHFRTRMSNCRLNFLTVISIHRKRALSIDLEKVVDRFVQKFSRCRLMLV